MKLSEYYKKHQTPITIGTILENSETGTKYIIARIGYTKIGLVIVHDPVSYIHTYDYSISISSDKRRNEIANGSNLTKDEMCRMCRGLFCKFSVVGCLNEYE